MEEAEGDTGERLMLSIGSSQLDSHFCDLVGGHSLTSRFRCANVFDPV